MWRRARSRDSQSVPVPFDSDLEFDKPSWRPLEMDAAVAEARRRGSEDGRVEVPASRDNNCHHIESLKNDAEQTLSAVGQDWSDMHRKLYGEWSRLWHHAEERETEIPGLEEEVKRLEAIVRRREKTCDERRTAIEHMGAHERHRMSRLAYLLGMGAVFLIDVPLNIVVFDIFNESPLFTYILAGLLGILIVPAAHVLGIQLRNRFNDKVITGLAVAIPLGLVVAIAVLRKDYLQAEHALAKSLNGWTGVAVFIAFNLAIFGSGVFLSYLRHDPYEQALEEADRAAARAKTERNAAEDRLQVRKREVASIRARMAELRAWAEQEFSKAKNRAHTQRNCFERLMHEYAGANKAARPHRGEPVKVLDDPTLWDVPTVPPELTVDELKEWRRPGTGAPITVPAMT
jgi:hypothetical protein